MTCWGSADMFSKSTFKSKLNEIHLIRSFNCIVWWHAQEALWRWIFLIWVRNEKHIWINPNICFFLSEKKSFRFAIYSGVDQKMQTIRMFKYKIYICHILLIRHEFVNWLPQLWRRQQNMKQFDDTVPPFSKFIPSRNTFCKIVRLLRLLRLWLWHQNTAHLKLLFHIILHIVGHLSFPYSITMIPVETLRVSNFKSKH